MKKISMQLLKSKKWEVVKHWLFSKAKPYGLEEEMHKIWISKEISNVGHYGRHQLISRTPCGMFEVKKEQKKSL